MRRLLLSCCALLLVVGCSAASDRPEGVRSKDLTIDLGGFTTKAQLTYPVTGNGPWPTVILFHGSGPMDMDATNAVGARVLSANFRLLAERLGKEGFAVLRFNKRGVNGYGRYDSNQVMKATANQLIADAGAVLAAAKARSEVDGQRIYLYGWSQGAQVAAHAAADHPEVAGVILQGPPTSGWSAILTYQHLTVGLPYLQTAADADHDGRLTVRELAGVTSGPAALMGSFYVWAPDSSPMNPRLRADTDADGDGAIDLEGELKPAVERLVANPGGAGNPFLDPANEPAHSIAEVVAGLKQPVLVLHGDRDGYVPLADGEKVAGAAPDRVTLKQYAALGHALSPVAEPARDTFGPMADQPITDLIAWLNGH